MCLVRVLQGSVSCATPDGVELRWSLDQTRTKTDQNRQRPRSRSLDAGQGPEERFIQQWCPGPNEVLLTQRVISLTFDPTLWPLNDTSVLAEGWQLRERLNFVNMPNARGAWTCSGERIWAWLIVGISSRNLWESLLSSGRATDDWRRRMTRDPRLFSLSWSRGASLFHSTQNCYTQKKT